MNRQRALEIVREIASCRVGTAATNAATIDRLADAILSAVAEEREACANLVDEYAMSGHIADDIRNRSKEQ